MAQSGYTPIQLYYSTTASNIPLAANMANGELAINIADGKIYYKNSSGVVTLFGSSGDVSTISFGTTGLTPSTSTGGAVTVAGTLVTSNGGTGLSSFTAGDLMYYASGTALSKLGIGTNGYILQSNGSAPTWVAASSVVGAGGSNTQIQYNSSGSLAGSSSLTFDGTTFTAGVPTVVSMSSSSDALRITQTGTGNALLVEDSANPDVSPFLINADGRIVSGRTSAISVGGSTPQLQIHTSTDFARARIAMFNWEANINSGSTAFYKSRSGTSGTYSIVSSGDILGAINFEGDDGTDFIRSASIQAQVDGTPGTNDMPGRLIFSTTADGASSPTERMRITNNGSVGIGGAPASTQRFVLSGSQTLGSSPQIFLNQQTIQSDSTSSPIYFDTYANLQATAFTVSTLQHYRAAQAPLSGGAAITNQRGFAVDSGLIGATNNYGFYSNIPSGTGRWNFYANGTATNYFAGNIGVGTTSPTAMLHTAGSSSIAALETPNIIEISTVTATAATGTINYDITTQSVLYYTSNASGNFTINFRGSSGTSLNTIMATGDTFTVTFLNTNGATAYYNSAVQVDGSSVTPKWQGGTAPTSGNASSIDAYTYAIVKTGSAAFTVLASQTKFA